MMPVNPASEATVLRGGHVIDPAQGIDGIADVTIVDGRLVGVGSTFVPAHANIIDVTGQFITPGWVDIHVHVYGTLGFADPDSIGVMQGVTSFVDAGGPGIDTLDEFSALLVGHTKTSLYVGAYLLQMGIVGVNFIEGDPRSLRDIAVGRWLDYVKSSPGLVRYLKMGVFGRFGVGPLKIGKGLAETLGLPLYVHIGEHQMGEPKESSYEIFRIASAGDIVTHAYHNNGTRLLDKEGKVLPLVREAEKRGVLFDVGFGGYNFSWKVAELAFAQDFIPQIISSDLQQFNVIGPAYSLANVMSVFLHLGLPLQQVIERVTINPAKALGLTDRAGTLRAGMPADITVFKVVDGDFRLEDTERNFRHSDRKIVPTMTFKNGSRFDCDMERCQDDRNWIMQVAEDAPPDSVRHLTSAQLQFLTALSEGLASETWSVATMENMDLGQATRLQNRFLQVQKASGLSLRDALIAVFSCFLHQLFTIQIGLLLTRLDRRFVLQRLAEVGTVSALA